jgi:predicted nucleic acid-binding protein
VKPRAGWRHSEAPNGGSSVLPVAARAPGKPVIIVDTSVWVNHLRATAPELVRALTDGEVLGHPHVTGELACGNLRNRVAVLELLRDLPQAVTATEDEALRCIDANRLQGRGLGWTDVHLLASALLTPARLWTLDAALAREARRCGVGGR